MYIHWDDKEECVYGYDCPNACANLEEHFENLSSTNAWVEFHDYITNGLAKEYPAGVAGKVLRNLSRDDYLDIIEGFWWLREETVLSTLGRLYLEGRL